jgi:peptidyl-prolyl cis-trans isomerase D
MLDALRRHSQSYLVYVFFGIIIVVFVFFFGPQSDGCSPSQATQVASVEGRTVLSLQVEQLYARVDSLERGLPQDQRLGPGARRRQLAEDIVLVRLLAREAREAGMNVSDDQFNAYIEDPDRNPDFPIYADRLGAFDYSRYELTVPGTFGMSIPEYETWKEDEILARRLMTMLAEAVVVTPDEVRALSRLRNTEYELEFVQLAPAELATLFATTDAEVQRLLRNEPERVRAYYDEHTEQFEQPRILRVRRIFIRLPGESDPDARADALARYEEALGLVNEDPDRFADVAAQYSQSTDAERGGDMGLKPVEDYLSYPFLEQRLQGLEVGDVATYESEVSRIIFRLEEDHPPAVTPFEEAREQAARALLASERDTVTLARELAQWFLEQAQSGMTLEEAAVEHARLRAASAPPGEAPPAPSQEEPAAPTGAIDPEATAAAEADPQTEDAGGEDAGGDTEEAAAPLVQVRRTGLFALDDPGMDLSQFGPQFAGQRSAPRSPVRIPRIGDAPDLAHDLTQLTPESPVATRVYEVEEGLVVARLLERREAPEQLEPAAFEALRQDLWREKVQQLFGFWEARVIFHRPLPLGPVLRQRLEQAIEDGDAEFNERYFVEPAVQPAS